MTKKDVKPVKKLVIVLDLNGTYSILDDPKKRKTQRARGPKHIGQGKIKRHLRISGISDKEMVKRVDAAMGILKKGVPVPSVEQLKKEIEGILDDNQKLHNEVEKLTDAMSAPEKPMAPEKPPVIEKPAPKK